MHPVRAIAVCALLLGGCAGASSGTIAAAALSTAVAVGASGVRRSAGDCYTPCVPGTTCNRATGYCEPLPCRGQCGPGEYCEVEGRTQRCVRVPTPQLQLSAPAADR